MVKALIIIILVFCVPLYGAIKYFSEGQWIMGSLLVVLLLSIISLPFIANKKGKNSDKKFTAAILFVLDMVLIIVLCAEGFGLWRNGNKSAGGWLLGISAVLFVVPLIGFFIMYCVDKRKNEKKAAEEKIKSEERAKIIAEVNSWRSNFYTEEDSLTDAAFEKAIKRRTKDLLEKYEEAHTEKLTRTQKAELRKKFTKEAECEAQKDLIYQAIVRGLEKLNETRKKQDGVFDRTLLTIKQMYQASGKYNSETQKEITEGENRIKNRAFNNRIEDEEYVCECYLSFCLNPEWLTKMGITDPYLPEHLPECYPKSSPALLAEAKKKPQHAVETQSVAKTPTKPQSSNKFYDDDDVKPCGTLASYGEPDGSFSMEELDFYDMMDEMDGYE